MSEKMNDVAITKVEYALQNLLVLDDEKAYDSQYTSFDDKIIYITQINLFKFLHKKK